MTDTTGSRASVAGSGLRIGVIEAKKAATFIAVEATSVKTSEKKDGERVLYAERSQASYARSFTLPMDVDQATSSASMAHGVLTLQLAKRGATKASQLTVN